MLFRSCIGRGEVNWGMACSGEGRAWAAGNAAARPRRGQRLRRWEGCPGQALETCGPDGQGLMCNLAVRQNKQGLTTCANDKQTLILRKLFLSNKAKAARRHPLGEGDAAAGRVGRVSASWA